MILFSAKSSNDIVSKNTWCKSSVTVRSATLWKNEKLLVLMVKIDVIPEIILIIFMLKV